MSDTNPIQNNPLSGNSPRPAIRPRTFSPSASRRPNTDSNSQSSFSPRGPRPPRREGSSFPPRPNGALSFQGSRRSGDFNRPSSGTPGSGFRPGRFQSKRRDQSASDEEKSNLQSKVIEVRRVTRVVKGGKRMRFSALVVVGDMQGQFGVGLKKGSDYADAVNKATNEAKKRIKKFSLNENASIPYAVAVKFKAARLFLKPAISGTGLIAGGPIRGILELAGIRNVLSKIIGSNNKLTNVMAVYQALSNFANK